MSSASSRQSKYVLASSWVISNSDQSLEPFWLVSLQDELSPEDKTCAAADHVEQSRIEELLRLSPGMVIGNGCPGAVLEVLGVYQWGGR